MPRPLTKPPPSSSVAGILEPGVGAAALTRSTLRPVLPTAVAIETAKARESTDPPVVSAEPADIARQFKLTRATDQTLKRIIGIYSNATGVDLKYSEFLRAVLLAVEHADAELSREAQLIGRLKRPKNDRENAAARDELERKICKAFVAGMRAVALIE